MTLSPLAVQDIHTVAVLGAGTMGNGIARCSRAPVTR